MEAGDDVWAAVVLCMGNVNRYVLAYLQDKRCPGKMWRNQDKIEGYSRLAAAYLPIYLPMATCAQTQPLFLSLYIISFV